MFLNDVLGDEDTTPVLLSDPRNTLYALITPDSVQKSFPDLLAHVPAEKTSRLPTIIHQDSLK